MMLNVIRHNSSLLSRGLASLLFCFALHSSPASALVCAVPGSSGPGSVTGIVNSYYPGRSNSVASSGSTSIPVGTLDGRGSSTAIAAGDLLLVIQIQDAAINSSNSSSYGGSAPGQGYTQINSAGAYEYVVASGPVSGGAVPITSALINTYTQASANTLQGQRTYQVIRVPQYSSATVTGTVTAPPWNGSTGGIVTFDVAGQLNWNGQTINVNALGFRGGAAQQSQSNGTGVTLFNTDYVARVGTGTLGTAAIGSVPNGAKGEGIAGTPIVVFVPTTPNNNNVAGSVINTGGTDGTSGGYPGGSFGRGAPGNAGGGGTDGQPNNANDENTGGAGGGNYGTGGTGGFGWIGLPAVPPGSQTGGLGGGSVPAAPSRLFMGGGGGAASTNNGTTSGFGILSSGASGGGLVLVRTGTVTGSGTINANGGNGNITAVPPNTPGTGVANDASGGAGAGGSVLVFVDNSGGATGTNINVNGGRGGNNAPGIDNNCPHGPGGGGGGGYAVLSGSPASISFNGGANGTTCSSPTTTSDYGSTNSPGGFTLVNLGPTQIPGAGASPICYPLITVTKSTTTPNVNQGGVITYTITASNQSGYGTATGLVISDTLPNNPNFTYAVTPSVVLAGGATRTAVVNPAAGATTPAWGTFSIPGGGSVTITFTVNVAAAAPLATYQNPATVTYNDPTATAAGQTITPGGTYAGGGTALGNNYASGSTTNEDVTVRTPATFSKSFSPTSISINGNSVMTVTIGNPSGIALSNAAFTDNYPAGLVNASVPNASTTCTGGTVIATANGTSFTLNGATIPITGCQVQVTVTSPVAGPFTNTIPAGALTNAQNITNTVAGTGTLLARPTIAKAFAPIAVAQNTNDTLTFAINNPNAVGLTGIAFTDSYPAGLVNATPLTTGGSCTGVVTTATAGGSTFNVTAGNVPASGSCTITVLVRSATAGNYPNTTGGVTSTQTPDSGLPSTTTALGVGLIVVNKAFAPTQIASGGTSTVTLTLNNPTGVGQTNGTLTDTLTNMSISANQTAGGTCGAFTGNGLTLGQTSLAFSGITIPSAGCTITFTVTSSTAGSNANTTSGISTSLLPVGPPSNTASLVVVQKPTIAKAFVPASIPPGSTGSLVLTITNPNTISLTGISFTDSYPVNLVNGTPLTVGGTCSGIVTTATAGGSTFNITNGTAPALSSCTITVPITSNTAGTYNNSTSGVATSETGSAGAASNTATLNVVVAPQVTAKSFSPSLISQNGISTMTVTLRNTNAVALTNVSFSDALTNMTVANGTIGGTCSGTISSPALVAGATNLNLTVPTIAGGATCTVTVQMTSNVSGANTNQTSGATSTQTPVPGSPSPVATLNVLRPPQLAKNFTPGQITVGGTANLSFTITNLNATTALTNVQFSDALANMTVASTSFSETCSGSVTFSPALTVGGSQVNPTLTSLAANETCTVSVTITSGSISPATGHINTTSGATSTETPIAGTGASTALDVLGPATIAKVFGTTTIQAGGTSIITFTLTNPNASVMTGAAFSDIFPAGMTTTAAAQTFTGAGRGTCTGAIPNSKAAGATASVSFAGINIPASGSCTVMVDVTAAAAGSYVNTVSGITTFQVPTAGPTAVASLNVLARPTVGKAFSPSTIASAANATLTVNINNPNPAAISLSALFTDTFPAGMTLAAAGSSGTCTGVTATNGAGSFTIANGTSIPAGGCTVIVTVTSSTVGAATNTIAAGGLQTTAGTNAAAGADTLTVVAAGTNRLIYTKTFSQALVQAGPVANANLDMVFTISNLSAGTAATDVRFNAADAIPLGGGQMTLNSAANSCTITAAVPANSCGYNGTTAIGTVVPNSANSTTSLNFATAGTGLRLAANSVCTLTCPVTIPAASTGGTYTNTATFLITGAGGFTDTTGDTASVTALKAPTITKAFAPAVIGAGSTTTLTFTLSNSAANTVAYSNATFTDTLTNMSIAGNQTAGGTCTGAAGNSFTNGQTGLLTLTGLMIPASGSCTVTLLVTSSNVAVNANTTSGVTTTQTPTAGTGAASVNLTVSGTVLTKAFAPTTVLTGAPSTLTFTVNNGAGNPAQSGLTFTDTLPAGLVVANPANASTTCGGGTVTAGSGSNVITLSGGGMALGQTTCTVKVDAVSNSAGSYPNTGAGNISGLSSGMTATTLSSTLTVNNHPTLTKTFTPATIGINGTSALAFTITNSAGNPVQSGLTFTDVLPAGVVISTPNGLSGVCGGAVTATAGTNVIILTGGALTAGTASCTITINTTSAAAGSYPNTNIGNISGLGGGLTATTLSSTLTVVGTTLSKTFTPVTQMLGSNSQLALTITNGSGNPAQSGLAFTDTLPAGLVIATPNGLSGLCGGAVTATAGTNVISLSGGALSAGTASCIINVNTIAASAGSYTNNAARISGTSSNIDASGVSAVVTYLAQAGISKAFAPNTIIADAPSTITFSLSNANSITLTGATFTDTLTGMAINANQSAGGSCGGVAGNSFTLGQTGLLTFTALSIPPGGCTVTVVVSSDVPGTYNNTTSGVTTTQTTVGAASNTAQLTVTAASPTIAKAFSPAIINQGTNTTITFTLTNSNGINLTSAGFSDTLTNMSISGAQAAGGTCAGVGSNNFANGQTNLTFSGLTIPLNSSCTVSILVTSNSIGTQSNQSSGVSSSQAPTGSPSNTVSLVVQALPTLTKAFSVGGTGTGLPATLTFTITNLAGAPARSGLTFTDTFPANLLIAAAPTVVNGCGGTPTITATAGTGSFTVAGTGVNAAAGASTCTISVNVSSNVPLAGYVNGTAQITAINGMLNGVTAQTLNVYAPPTVTKTFTPGSISVGGTSSMIITVSNPAANPGNLTGVAINDTYSGTLVNNAAGSVACSGAGSATLTGGVNGGTAVGFNAGTIIPGGTCTITQSVTATATTNNTTGAPTATGPVALTGTAAGPITLTVNVLPTLNKAFSPAAVDVYTTSTMTFTLSNPNGNTLTSAKFTDTLTGFSVAAPATIGGTCAGVTNSPALVAGATSLNLTVPSLASGVCTITIPVSAISSGSYTNTTSGITSVETGASIGTPSNTATLTVNFLPLQVTKTPSVLTASPGSIINYVIGYGNPNATTLLQNVIITDPVPVYTTFQSATCGPLPPGITSCTVTAPAVGGTGTVTWTLGGTLNAGSSGTVTLSVRVD